MAKKKAQTSAVLEVSNVRHVELEQGSEAWHAWRAGRYTASQAAAVLNVSPWFPRTPLELYQLRTGQRQVFVNAAMRAGTASEPRAMELLRDARSKFLVASDVEPAGLRVDPACIEAEVAGMKLGASLDALLRYGEAQTGWMALDIKTPAGGSESDLWKQNEIPAYYRAQLLHQMLCVPEVQAATLVVYAVDLDQIKILPAILREDVVDELAALVQAWKAFDDAVSDLLPPEATDRDVVELDGGDVEFSEAARQWLDAKAAVEAAEAEADKAKEALLELVKARGMGAAVKGCGVTAYRSTRTGNVNWKAPAIVAALSAAQIDPEDFRGKGSTFWTVKGA